MKFEVEVMDRYGLSAEQAERMIRDGFRRRATDVAVRRIEEPERVLEVPLFTLVENERFSYHGRVWRLTYLRRNEAGDMVYAEATGEQFSNVLAFRALGTRSWSAALDDPPTVATRVRRMP
jgi:hypothetical protein